MAAVVPVVRPLPRQLAPAAASGWILSDGKEPAFVGSGPKKNAKIGEDRNVLFSPLFLWFWLGNRITSGFFGYFF